MPKCNFNKVVLRWIFSEHLFLRTTLNGYFWKFYLHKHKEFNRVNRKQLKIFKTFLEYVEFYIVAY